VILFLRNRYPTPLVIFFTTSSLKDIMAAEIYRGVLDLDSPLGEMMNQIVKAIGAIEQRLEGMQPMFRQVPPRNSRSAHATFIPSCAARIAAV